MFTYEVTLLATASSWASPGPESQEATVLVESENDFDARNKAQAMVVSHKQAYFTNPNRWSVVSIKVIADDGFRHFRIR